MEFPNFSHVFPIITTASRNELQINRGCLNIQSAMSIIDSLLIFQRFSIQYSATYRVRNCNTIMHSYGNTAL